MKKIITAIKSPEINEQLKKEKNIEIIGKDIQYREAILEILEKIKDINIIVLYEKILGKINIEELLTKIRMINSNIDIIFFLEKEDKEKIKKLKEKNIQKIYMKNELKIENLINIINDKKIEKKVPKIKNKINILIKEKIKIYNKNNNKKIIIIGKNKIEKNILIIFIIKYLEKINKKILLINFNEINKKTFLKLNEKNKYKKFNNKKINYKEIKNKEEIKKYINKIQFKVNKNITCISDINNLLKNIYCKKLKMECINILLEDKEKNFDYIIVSDGHICDKKIKNKIMEKCDKTIWILEKTYTGIEGAKQFIRDIKRYICNKNNLHIVMENNKIERISLSIFKEIYKQDAKINFLNLEKEYKNYKKYKKIKNILNKKIKIKKLLNI